eukprot:g80919.t1
MKMKKPLMRKEWLEDFIFVKYINAQWKPKPKSRVKKNSRQSSEISQAKKWQSKMEEVVEALQGARLEDDSDDEEQDDPAPDVTPAVAPAVAIQARERWIDDVRQVRVDKEEDEFVVKIHESFLNQSKKLR